MLTGVLFKKARSKAKDDGHWYIALSDSEPVHLRLVETAQEMDWNHSVSKGSEKSVSEKVSLE